MKGYKNGRRKKNPVFFLPRSVLLIYHTLQSPSIFYPCVHASVSGDLQRHLLLPSQSTITPLETSSPHASSLEVQNAGLSILLPPRHLPLLLPNARAAPAKHPVKSRHRSSPSLAMRLVSSVLALPLARLAPSIRQARWLVPPSAQHCPLVLAINSFTPWRLPGRRSPATSPVFSPWLPSSSPLPMFSISHADLHSSLDRWRTRTFLSSCSNRRHSVSHAVVPSQSSPVLPRPYRVLQQALRRSSGNN